MLEDAAMQDQSETPVGPRPHAELAAELAQAFGAARGGGILVVTGAGISVASGIPSFRGSDPGAVWKQDLTELATRRFFEADPASSWAWYLERFDHALAAQPNAAHRAIAALERWQEARQGSFLLVTQNVDTLHEAAGSRRMVKVHGSASRVRCSRRGCSHAAPHGSLPREAADLARFREAPGIDTVPRCPACRSYLRPHVLWFDEYYQEHDDYGIERVLGAAAEARLVLFAGTSFSVGITDLLLGIAEQVGADRLAIDPNPPAQRPQGLRLLEAPAEELLPTTITLLPASTRTAAT
jgi:NAD-dependent deacetylase